MNWYIEECKPSKKLPAFRLVHFDAAANADKKGQNAISFDPDQFLYNVRQKLTTKQNALNPRKKAIKVFY